MFSKYAVNVDFLSAGSRIFSSSDNKLATQTHFGVSLGNEGGNQELLIKKAG